MSEPTAVTNEDVVARGGEYYRRMRYLVAAILLAAGVWFAYDGWVGWPRINDRIADIKQQINDQDEHTEVGKKHRADLTEQLKDLKPHDDLAILLQKLLAFGLPLVGIGLVAWAHHNSRGEIRLSHDTLSAPGHPKVTMDQIVALDKRLWDKKDIAYIDYEAADKKGRIRLDAFVYQTDPIVKIYDRIEAVMKEDSEAQ